MLSPEEHNLLIDTFDKVCTVKFPSTCGTFPEASSNRRGRSFVEYGRSAENTGTRGILVRAETKFGFHGAESDS